MSLVSGLIEKSQSDTDQQVMGLLGTLRVILISKS